MATESKQQTVYLNMWDYIHDIEKWYEDREKNHVPFLGYVKNFIEANSVKTMLEIGGGTGRLASWVSDAYVNIDMSKRAIEEGRKKGMTHAEFIHADWLTFDVHSMVKRFDLILAGAVIEHCYRFQPFLRNVIEAKPRFAIVSFIYGLNREKERRKGKRYPGGLWVRDHHYAERDITRFIEQHGVDLYEYRTVPSSGARSRRYSDTILTMYFGQ